MNHNRMLVLGNFNREETVTIVRDAEFRGCTKIYFLKDYSKQPPWHNFNYIICSEEAYNRFKKILIIASLRRTVCVLYKKPQNVKLINDNITPCYISKKTKSIMGIHYSYFHCQN